MESISILMRDADSSIRSMALSGQEAVGDVAVRQHRGGHARRSRICARRGAPRTSPSGRGGWRWCPPRDGSLVKTGWNRRSSALSFSMYFWYSLSVVAPMQRSSPRASAGFSMLEASMAPSAAPAPTRVWSSSMKRITSPGGLLDLVDHGLEPLLELAAVLGAGDERPHVQGHQPLVFQVLRHVALDDPPGQALDDGGLSHARLADEHRVVLGAPGQHLHDAPDLLVPADDRVELVHARQPGEVPC